MRQHLIDELRVGPVLRFEAEFRVGGSLLTE